MEADDLILGPALAVAPVPQPTSATARLAVRGTHQRRQLIAPIVGHRSGEAACSGTAHQGNMPGVVVVVVVGPCEAVVDGTETAGHEQWTPLLQPHTTATTVARAANSLTSA